MSTDKSLPSDVVDAIHANRKIEAIKLLREHRGIGLKEAKLEVDAYIHDHKDLLPQQQSGGCLRVLAIIAAVVLLTFFIYEQIK